jgi:hypothetical protein
LADYLEKTGSVSADTRDLLDRMSRYIDKQDHAKTASIAATKDRAGSLAQKMAGFLMLSGAPLIEGYEMVKQAEAMMTSHDEALELLDMVLDSMKDDRLKHAALEPGRPSGSAVPAHALTAGEQLYVDNGIQPPPRR